MVAMTARVIVAVVLLANVVLPFVLLQGNPKTHQSIILLIRIHVGVDDSSGHYWGWNGSRTERTIGSGTLAKGKLEMTRSGG
jgi:hypothetical protein